MGITIKQIAQLSGVSRGTVDRVIHERNGVDEQTREHIKRMIKELDYKPNSVAKALKKSQKQLNLGVVLPNNENMFFLDIYRGIDEAAAAYEPNGVKVHKLEMERAIVSAQIQKIDLALELGVDGILLLAMEDPRIQKKINSIPDSIPVITFNTDVTNTNRLCFVGQNHTAAGRVAGSLMSSIISPEGTVAMLFSQPDFLSHTQRTEGFKQRLTEIYPAIKIFEPFCTYESDAIAYQVVTNLIQEHDDLSGIFVAGGGQIGAGDALNDSGKGHEIKMICFDLLPQTVNHVKNGVVDFTIGQDPFIQGYMPIKLMYEYLAYGTRPKREYLYTNIDIRVKDNISYKGFEIFTGSYMSEV